MMAVENNTIIQKMMNELQQANESLNNQQVLIRHIENVRLLCDLMVEKDIPEESQNENIKKMIEDKKMNQPKNPATIDHDQANGKSLFDF